MAVLDAGPFAEGVVSFRSSMPGECLTGEPMLLAKDLYRRGRGKILAVLTVNHAYSEDEAAGTKAVRGNVHGRVNVSRSRLDQEETVSWQRGPRAMVECPPTLKIRVGSSQHRLGDDNDTYCLDPHFDWTPVSAQLGISMEYMRYFCAWPEYVKSRHDLFVLHVLHTLVHSSYSFSPKSKQTDTRPLSLTAPRHKRQSVPR